MKKKNETVQEWAERESKQMSNKMFKYWYEKLNKKDQQIVRKLLKTYSSDVLKTAAFKC